MIKVENLSKTYFHKGKAKTVFRNINFKINTGESLAILGRNGAGKSSLLNIIGGIDQQDSGEIIKDCSVSWPIGLAGGFQGSLTGRENVTFVSKLIYGEKKLLIRKCIEFVEEFAEIGTYFDMPFNTYSKGMRLRVSFGLSMAIPFDVYLIDEITGAGDQKFRKKSKKFLMDKFSNSSFIMVDHNLKGLSQFCSKALVLHNGSALMYDSVNEAIKMHNYLLFNT